MSAARQRPPIRFCLRRDRVEIHAGTEVLAGDEMAALGVTAYRLHAHDGQASALLLDPDEQVIGAVTMDLPGDRPLGHEAIYLRILRHDHLYEVDASRDRFELVVNRERRALLEYDEETDLWMGSVASMRLLDEATEAMAVANALMGELAEEGLLELID